MKGFLPFLIYLFCFGLNLVIGVTLSGRITNGENEKALPNVNIFVQPDGYGSISSPYGEYKIELQPGEYSVNFSIIGFEKITHEVWIEESPMELNVRMSPSVLEFDEIQVEGIFSTRLGFESVDILDKKKIDELKKESAAEILSEIPGIDVQFAHGSGRNVNVSIRGSSDYKPGGYNNRVMILLDGFPLLIPNSGSPDWSSIPLESISRIEVDHNAASSQYGHNSMGGVINLITDQKSSKEDLIFRLTSGSYQLKQGSISSKLHRGNWHFGLTGMARHSSGHRFNSDDQLVRVRVFGKLQDNKGRTHSLSFINALSETGHPGFKSFPTWRRSKRFSSYIQGHFFYPLTDGLSLSNSVYMNSFQTEYFDRNDTPPDKLEKNENYHDKSIGVRSEMLLTRWSRWIIMTGMEAGWDKSDVTVFDPIYDSPVQGTFGGFIQSKYSIGGGWNFGSGLRYDYRYVNPGKEFSNRIYTHFSPKLNLMYAMKNERAFTLTYSEGFRAPSLSELYLLHPTSYGLTVQGNRNLNPEKVQTVEVRYEHPHSSNWKWNLAMFKNRYENMIDFVYSLPTIAVNRVGVSGFGGEFQFFLALSKYLNISGNYSYLNMSDRGGDPILYRSKHRVSLHTKIMTQIGNFSFHSKYWSSQKYDDFLSHDYKTVAGKIIFPIEELQGKVKLDGGFEKKMGEYEISIQIENIFDMNYEVIQDYPMPGRVWKVELNRSFN
jgi:outer membrane receptor for ferrienterochelin and colicins